MPLFKKLNVLTFHDLCIINDYKFCFRVENEMVPAFFHSKNNMPECLVIYSDKDEMINSKLNTHILDDFKRYIKCTTFTWILISLHI